jgi:hypothetical protein
LTGGDGEVEAAEDGLLWTGGIAEMYIAELDGAFDRF